MTRRGTRAEVGAVLSAVATAACTGGSTPESPSPTPTVEVQPAVGAMRAVPASSAAAEDSGDPRIRRLRQRKEWRAFAALWRELDRIEPPERDAGRGLPNEVYGMAIDAERGERLSQRLGEVARGLEQAKLLAPEERAFLRQLAALRIRNMQYGSMQLMFMHQLPPPYLAQRYATVDELERRIDVLVELRRQGQIDTPEYDQALAEVRRQAVTAYLVYELDREGRGWRGRLIDVTDGEQMLADLDRRLAAAADAGTTEPHLGAVAQRAKELVPAVRALVTELER